MLADLVCLWNSCLQNAVVVRACIIHCAKSSLSSQWRYPQAFERKLTWALHAMGMLVLRELTAIFTLLAMKNATAK